MLAERLTGFAAVTVCLLVGCGGGDTKPRADVGSSDRHHLADVTADSGDGASLDLGPDRAAVADASGADAANGNDADLPGMRVCVPANIVDLATAGTVNGNTTTYVGSNAAGSALEELGAPVDCSTAALVDRQLALRYKLTTSAQLRVSTDDPATGNLDTVVWLLDACTTTANVLGCNDDAPSNNHSTLVTAGVIPAGTELVVIVGVASLAPTAPSDGGTFTLTIEELVVPPPGGVCDATMSGNCGPGQSCVTRAQLGTCIDDGTAPLSVCRAMGDAAGRCDTGLVCTATSDGPELCFTAAASGGACDFQTSECPQGNLCLPTFASRTQSTSAGVCRANGTLGGYCDAMTACGATGLNCSSSDTGGVCQTLVLVGGACDPVASALSSTLCDVGSSCVPNGASSFACQADGTAAGAACRQGTTQVPCDGALVCNVPTGGVGVCQNAVGRDTACSPRFSVDACAAPEVCGAQSFLAGQCTVPTAEQATPHPDFASAQNVTLAQGNAALAGALTADDEFDCYLIAVAQGGSVFAEIGDGAGGCPGDSALYLIDSQERVIAFNDDSPLNACPVIDAGDPTSTARNLDAGNYAVCATPSQSATGAAIPAYVLSISVQ